MMNNPIQIEDIDYISNSFESTGSDLHHLQTDLPAKRLKFIYMVRSEEFNPPFKLVSIQVPANLALYKVRFFIQFLNDSLHNTYGLAQRLPYALIRDEDSTIWKLISHIPISGIRYI